MQILIYFPSMTEEDIQGFEAVTAGHRVLHARSTDEAIRMAPGSEVVLGILPESVFQACTHVKWFQSASAGMDQVLFPALIESDVTVTNMAGLYARAGAEQAWALLLALARGVHHTVTKFPARDWSRVPIQELSDCTALVLGMGGFGQEFVKRGAGYDLTVLALDPVQKEFAGVQEIRLPTRANLHAFLPLADLVVSACPLTEDTYHLISHEELALMKSSALLVNVSRGGIIDEQALSTALQSDMIAGAGLDVVETEPLPADSPLWETPNLILTPHQAGFSADRHSNIVSFFQTNLRLYLNDQPLRNVVNKKLGF